MQTSLAPCRPYFIGHAALLPAAAPRAARCQVRRTDDVMPSFLSVPLDDGHLGAGGHFVEPASDEAATCTYKRAPSLRGGELTRMARPEPIRLGDLSRATSGVQHDIVPLALRKRLVPAGVAPRGGGREGGRRGVRTPRGFLTWFLGRNYALPSSKVTSRGGWPPVAAPTAYNFVRGNRLGHQDSQCAVLLVPEREVGHAVEA